MIRSVTLKTSFVIALLVAVVAHADIMVYFKYINGEGGFKGPFDKNVLQSELGRNPVLEGAPAGTTLFQAAFRNEGAKILAVNYDFYVGNLFTTNYYELMGEYVYGDAYGNHAIDNGALLSKGATALPKASSMVRHWVLEKQYTRLFPASRLARSFLLRGISDLNNEQTYAVYFMNFYMSVITDEYQYLPAYLLSKDSPIVSSASLEKARVDVANLYDAMKSEYGEKDTGVVKLYKLRNAIHNQLSSSVIGQIDAYIAAHPNYGKETLVQIRENIRAYYSTSAKKVFDLAKKVPAAAAIGAAAAEIMAAKANPTNLLKLSQAVATLRSEIQNEAVVTYANKTDALVLLISASQYINKEINSMSVITSKEVIKAIVNVVYAEGFLIKDNWQYFNAEIDRSATAVAAAALFADMSEIAQDTLTQAFKPSLDQWLGIEPKMQYFLDNTIKSSALNTASTILPKIK